MKILLQRVSQASVEVDGNVVGRTGRGYLLLVGILHGDTEDDARFLARKVAALRLFDGPDGKVNDLCLKDIGGGVLVISQFTLAGRTEKGNRPDYTGAAERGIAERLYERFAQMLSEEGVTQVERGRFGAAMQVHLTNDGPVTLLLEKAGNVPL
jgi:D-tyrosyl-tRNA(Tyr) deacylase